MALWRIRATVDDRPGFLAVLTASLALRSVNILSVQVHATELGAVDDFLVDAPDALTETQLTAAVIKGRGRDPWVSRTDAYDLVDPPTHLLGLAARLVRDNQELDTTLAALLDCRVRWRPDEGPTWQGFMDSAMALPDPAGGTLYLDRDAPQFTPAEYARAHALVDLAGTIAERLSNHWQLLLRDGSEVSVRLAGPDDADAVAALYQQCGPPGRHPGRLSLGQALVALGGTGRVVAVANLVSDGTEAELGLLVQDGWRRRGLGTALLRRAVRLATASGIEALHAHARAEDHATLRTMRRLGLPLRHEADGGMLTVSADLRGAGVTAQTGSPFPAR